MLDRSRSLHHGDLEVRIAADPADVAAAQALRARVFHGGSAPDSDVFDAVCDHLVAFDRRTSTAVGTYRLIRRGTAARVGGFYSAGEFDLSPLLDYPGEILELGRSCVEHDFRARPVLDLLWRGIAAYVRHHDVALMFGCASLPGTDPGPWAEVLAWLRHRHLAPERLRVRARPERRAPVAPLPPDAIDTARVRASLPPLLKGYLRLGGFVGDGAVVDDSFGTVDVCVVVETGLMAPRYARRYALADRLAAG